MNTVEVIREKNANFLSNMVKNAYSFSYPNKISEISWYSFSQVNRIVIEKP